MVNRGGYCMDSSLYRFFTVCCLKSGYLSTISTTRLGCAGFSAKRNSSLHALSRACHIQINPQSARTTNVDLNQ